MKTFLVVLFLTLGMVSNAQVDVNKETIKAHIGDSVKYCGKVVSARLMDRMMNAPAFLNIDGAYPNQVFTVVVWKADRVKFREKPEQYYLNKNVCIYGKVEKYKEQLQIAIHSEAQIIIQE